MVINKRAQFFLLAAVIISVAVLSLGIILNRATVTPEPGNFYDFSYEMKREVGSVIDYDIYTNVAGGNLSDFVEILAADIADKNPDANFMFIYGNSDGMELRNYGSEDAFVGGDSVSGAGAGVISRICYGGSCRNVSTTIDNFYDGVGNRSLTSTDLAGGNINVTVGGSVFDFPVSEHDQVIFIIQKTGGGDSYVAVN